MAIEDGVAVGVRDEGLVGGHGAETSEGGDCEAGGSQRGSQGGRDRGAGHEDPAISGGATRQGPPGYEGGVAQERSV